MSEFGQIVAIWRHFWIVIELGIMKGHTGVTDIGNVDFIFMPSAELIQEMSQASLKIKKSQLSLFPTN